MALESCNNMLKGIAYESASGSLKYLEPGSSVKIRLDISFISDRNKIMEARSEIRNLSL